MRYFVTGPTGSGKSTLARALAKHTRSSLSSLDDIHWLRAPDGDRRRDPAERAALLDGIVEGESWVIEGVQFKWADAALDRADRIVVLDLPQWRNLARIARRFLRRNLGGEAGSRGTIAALKQELQWSRDYYQYERTLLLDKLHRMRGKVVLIGGGSTLHVVSALTETESRLEASGRLDSP